MTIPIILDNTKYKGITIGLEPRGFHMMWKN